MTIFVGHRFWALFIFLGLQGRSVSFKTKKYAMLAKLRGKGKGKGGLEAEPQATCPFAAQAGAP